MNSNMSASKKITKIPHICHEIFKNLLISDLEIYDKLRDSKNFCNALNIEIAPECAAMLDQLEQELELVEKFALFAHSKYVNSYDQYFQLLWILDYGRDWHPDKD